MKHYKDINVVKLLDDWQEGLQKIWRAMKLDDPDHRRALHFLLNNHLLAGKICHPILPPPKNRKEPMIRTIVMLSLFFVALSAANAEQQQTPTSSEMAPSEMAAKWIADFLTETAKSQKDKFLGCGLDPACHVCKANCSVAQANALNACLLLPPGLQGPCINKVNSAADRCKRDCE